MILPNTQKLEISSVGVGTYKGSLNEDDDLLMFNAIVDSALFGMNVIDTCSNFRGGRSEKMVGNALEYLFQNHQFTRQEFLISSKAGYVREKLPSLDSSDIINDHCAHPLFL